MDRIVLMNGTRDLAMSPFGIRVMLLKSIRNFGYRKWQPEAVNMPKHYTTEQKGQEIRGSENKKNEKRKKAVVAPFIKLSTLEIVFEPQNSGRTRKTLRQ